LIRLSGASFFIYLVHEFPLRAIVERWSRGCLDESTSCWLLTPIVLLGCYVAMILLDRTLPSLLAVLTGGRTPSLADRGTQTAAQSTPAHAC
jgi:hypothetical protein